MMKFDFDDILLQPSATSNINSRSEIDILDNQDMLPLFTAPMDTVVSEENASLFVNNGIKVILPRKKFNEISYISTDPTCWNSYGLDEFKELFLQNSPDNRGATMYALIDVANGHMSGILSTVKESKTKYGSNLVLMVGNIANPNTYALLSDAGADYIRIGIGNGGGCLTTVQTGVGYPMASLIQECFTLSKKCKRPAKIVADGGMQKYSDIIKALALGADYVMLGSVLNKALESAGETYYANKKSNGWTEPGERADQFDLKVSEYFKFGGELYKKFRGMSTKEVQHSWGNEDIKTSEGITRMQKVEYTISGWVENFSHYLRTAMSYTNCRTLYRFKGVEIIQISEKSFERFMK